MVLSRRLWDATIAITVGGVRVMYGTNLGSRDTLNSVCSPICACSHVLGQHSIAIFRDQRDTQPG